MEEHDDVEAARVATHALPAALKVLLAFNALVIAVHVLVAQAIRLPPGYQLRTDAHGGGPGDGLYVLFVLVMLVRKASARGTALRRGVLKSRLAQQS